VGGEKTLRFSGAGPEDEEIAKAERRGQSLVKKIDRWNVLVETRRGQEIRRRRFCAGRRTSDSGSRETIILRRGTADWIGGCGEGNEDEGGGKI